jgi:putative tryptophan/tyrosine transport system substrate-binding protein
MKRVRRRAFPRCVVGLGVTTGGLELLSAQCGILPSQPPRRVPRIGYLSGVPRADITDSLDAFQQRLNELDYVDGQTVEIDWRFTPQAPDASTNFDQAAAELVALPVDVIVVVGTGQAAVAARRATSTIPIIWSSAKNPVGIGLAESMAHPGGNVTRVTGDAAGLYAKRLDLMRNVVPGLNRLAVPVDVLSPSMGTAFDELRGAAQAVGVQAERVEVTSEEDVLAAFDIPEFARAQAMVILALGQLLSVQAQVAQLALQHRLPAISSYSKLTEASLLMSYGAALLATVRRTADYLDKILKGAKPADLPIEQPTQFDLAVNLKTLQALGLTIPPSVLPLVTEWIQ